MTILAHLETLQQKHAKLDTDIQTELRLPMPNTLRLSEMKKEKLRLKELITQLKAA